jgi:hypothetical protein
VAAKKEEQNSWIDELDGILAEMEREDRAREKMMAGRQPNLVEERNLEDDLEEIELEEQSEVNADGSEGESAGGAVASGEDVVSEDDSGVEVDAAGPTFLEDGQTESVPELPLEVELSDIKQIDMIIPDR